jgi:glycosyltransferase involved in cell wall biosynthesis
MKNNPSHNEHNIDPHLVWIFPGRLDASLDGATWLKTTHELRKLGWNVTLISAGEDGYQTIRGVSVYCISTPEIFFIRQFIFHLKLLFFLVARLHNIHVILFNQPSAPWIFPIFLLRLIGGSSTPILVMDTRTVPMEDLRKASLRDRLRGDYLLLMNRFGNWWADGQTAITRRMAERVRIRPDRLWGIWSSGADLAQFGRAIELRKWPVGKEPVFLTYIGVLHYERNLLALCQAVELANQEGMNFRLVLTGLGTQREELIEFAKKTDGRIRVNPPVPHNRVPDLLGEIHVGAIPFPDEDKYRVSSPIKLFEYMAAGLPILATRIVCHTDVIDNDSFVIWAEGATPADLLTALRKLWDLRSMLEYMSHKSFAFAHHFTWAESARRLSDALRIGLRNISLDISTSFLHENKTSD